MANDAATLANQKAALANTAAGAANDAATLANTKAGAANDAANLANTKAGLANDAAALANEKAGDANDAALAANNAAAAADDARLAIQDDLAKKANIDGAYDGLYAGTSGTAQNLAGRGSVPAEYLFRTTGGTADVGTGTALIKALKGNTQVWNQLCNTPSGGSNASVDNRFSFKPEIWATLNGNEASRIVALGSHTFSEENFIISAIITFPSGSYNGILFKHDGLSTNINMFSATGSVAGHKYLVSCFIETCDVTSVGGLQWKNCQVIDLTRLFNGSVPDGYTVDDFKADFPLLYYNFNAGKILPFLGQKIVTPGANLYNPATGEAELPQVDPAIGFKIQGTFTSVAFTPAGESASVAVTPDANGQFSTSGAGTLSVTGGNSTDTMVYIYWSQKDLDYEPYELHELNLGIDTLTGKVNGEGDSVVIFGSDGMNSAGSAKDELVVDADGYARKAIKRLGKVGLGDLTWVLANNRFFSQNVPVAAASATGTPNALCNRYTVTAAGNVQYVDKTASITGIYAYCKDDSYNDAETFKAAMASQNVQFIYELATPIEYTLDTPLFLGYYANDWGTEAIKPDNGADPYTAPANYDVQYPLNAADMLRNLVRNYMSINSDNADDSAMKALAGALSSALGIAITWTWSEADREYTFSVADNRAFKVVGVPASASAAGTAGNIAFDSSYLYICVASNTWKRVALATW